MTMPISNAPQRSRALLGGLMVAALLVTSGSLFGCRSMVFVDGSGNRITRGSKAVTLVNLHAHKKTLSSVNRQGPELIPVCTEIEIFELGSKRMGFRIAGSRQPYYFRYHKAAAEPFAQNLARYFGGRCPQAEIASMSALDQYGIEQGKPYIGMTKQGIILAMGYPPKHRTPSLSADSWRYWGRRATYVKFDSNGIVQYVQGMDAAAVKPPENLAPRTVAGSGEPSGRYSMSPQSAAQQPAQPSTAPSYTPPPPQTARRRAPAGLETGDDRLYSKRVAVVIGINAYRHWPSLSGAAGDGQRVAKFLREEGWDEVIEIYDDEATRRRMLKMLGTELPRLTDENTLAMIYFAGHGQTETLPGGGKRGYLIPVDADTDDVFSTAISMDTVRDLSKRTPAKHVYYAIDACYSGLALTRGITRPGSGPPDIYLRKITSVPAVQIITAGADGEQAIEIGGQGLFTSYLLRAMGGEADFNHDGAVTASEIGAYVKPQVTNASRNQQTPQFGTMEGSGEIVFMRPR
jgi:hypothetical protein